jgi:hypothetical protein
MTQIATTTTETGSWRRLRSAAAVLLGFLSVAVLSLATDQILHVLGVYPPWGEPMWEPGLNLLALSYRMLYTVLGGYITARLAPGSPMRHVAVVGILGLIAGTAGAIAAITLADLGPNWYPIALAATGFPCVWLGGVLHGLSPSTRARS